MRPRIAVNCDVDGGNEGRRERSYLYTDYLDALVEAGADPWPIPPHESSLSAIGSFDAVLLTGGDDYRASLDDPEHPPPDTIEIHPRRERFDLSLGRLVLERDLPVLGICAGFQLQVLLGGGRIIGDIPTEVGARVLHRRVGPEDPRPRHRVEWSPAGPIDLPSGGPTVMSHHHQGVGSLPPDWQPWAVAEDGVIEAAIGPGRWQVGVQWHPELDPRDRHSRALFRAFVAAAQEVEVP